MSQFYYAGSSLPMLIEESLPPINESQFIEIINSGVPKNVVKKILSFRFSDGSPVGALTKLGSVFWNLEKNLRNELVRLRSSILSVDPKNSLTDDEIDPFVSEVAAEAIKAESPLVAEEVLDNWRWKMADQLGVGHFYDEDFFTAYYLKLQILLRKEQFDVKKGKAAFESVYQKVLNDKDQETGESR